MVLRVGDEVVVRKTGMKGIVKYLYSIGAGGADLWHEYTVELENGMQVKFQEEELRCPNKEIDGIAALLDWF